MISAFSLLTALSSSSICWRETSVNWRRWRMAEVGKRQHLKKFDFFIEIENLYCRVRFQRRSSLVRLWPIPEYQRKKSKSSICHRFNAKPVGALICLVRRLIFHCELNSSLVRAEFQIWSEDKHFNRFFKVVKRQFSYEKNNFIQFDLVLSQTFVERLNLAKQIAKSSTFASFSAQVQLDIGSVSFRAWKCIGWKNKNSKSNKYFSLTKKNSQRTSFSCVNTSLANFSLWYCSRNSVTSFFNCAILFSRFSLTLRHRSFSLTWRILSFCKSSFSSSRLSRCRCNSSLTFCKRSQSARNESIWAFKVLTERKSEIEIKTCFLQFVFSLLPNESFPCCFVRDSMFPRHSLSDHDHVLYHRIDDEVHRFVICNCLPVVRNDDDHRHFDWVVLSIDGWCRERCPISFVNRGPRRDSFQ